MSQVTEFVTRMKKINKKHESGFQRKEQLAKSGNKEESLKVDPFKMERALTQKSATLNEKERI
jgi:hypothetical protein